MAKDRFGHGEDDMKKGWDIVRKEAPIFEWDYTQTGFGYEFLEKTMKNIIDKKGIDSWEEFVKNYEDKLKRNVEGSGEFIFERLGQEFPDLYGEHYENSPYKDLMEEWR